MCKSYVSAEAQGALVDLLREIAAALQPDAVQIGPVDFGDRASS